MSDTWEPGGAGVLRLPSGRLVRGRALRRPIPVGATPDFTLALSGTAPAPLDWPSRWLGWPDFRLPLDADKARDALLEAWRRCATERVEISCAGGRGRTGTALACLAVLDGLPADKAVGFVRSGYHRRAVETPGQRRFVRTFETWAQPNRP